MGRRGKPQQNLVGQRFNHLTVLEMLPGNLSCKPSVLCQCDCGNTVIAVTGNLKTGNTKSCGCMKHGHGGPRKKVEQLVERTPDQCRRLSPKADLTGQRFGMITVTGFAGRDRNGKPVFDCVCDCGKTCLIRGSSLTEGNTKSCGCYRAIKAREINTTHGDSSPDSKYKRLYHTWILMKERCYNLNDDYYDCYGGRGITVCDEWLDWIQFREWSLSHGWSPELSIDRIDVDRGYSPDNCRWADATTQAYNTRNSVRVDWNGMRISAWDWAMMNDVPYLPAKQLIAEGNEPTLVLDFLKAEQEAENGRGERVPAAPDNRIMAGKKEDYVGRVFDYLTVERMAGRDRNRNTLVECRCVCGTVKTFRLNHLLAGRSKSCGCMRGRLVAKKVTKHGDSKEDSRLFKLYRIWVDMRHRTVFEKYKDTGRPIGVSEEWLNWTDFKEWSLSHGYGDGMILERKDLSLPYSPENCRWVTKWDPDTLTGGEMR